VLVVLVIIISNSDFFSNNAGVENSIEYVDDVSMNIISPSWSIEYKNISTENVTVADFLLECAYKNNFTVEKDFWSGYDSFFIVAINNIHNGEDGKYWQYYINGNFSDVGCSNYLLDNNDVVEWRFELPRW
jgi:hypothetical protein